MRVQFLPGGPISKMDVHGVVVAFFAVTEAFPPRSSILKLSPGLACGCAVSPSTVPRMGSLAIYQDRSGKTDLGSSPSN